MHLRLVDTTMDRNLSCEDCLIFDQITETCGVFTGIPDNTANTCNLYVVRADFEHEHIYNEKLLEDSPMKLSNEQEIPPESESYRIGIQGTKKITNSKYPFQPDIPTNRKDAIWYVSPEQSFGCWIISEYEKKFMLTNTLEKVNKSKPYRSTFPLHNHNESEQLIPFICWHVNKKGDGQYVMLINGKIVPIYT